MHEQGLAFGVCLANVVSMPDQGAREGVLEVVVHDAQLCQACTQAV